MKDHSEMGETEKKIYAKYLVQRFVLHNLPKWCNDREKLLEYLLKVEEQAKNQFTKDQYADIEVAIKSMRVDALAETNAELNDAWTRLKEAMKKIGKHWED